jgi:hypothetical protein
MPLLFADIHLHQIPADSSHIRREVMRVSVQYGSPPWSILLIPVFEGQSGFDRFPKHPARNDAHAARTMARQQNE